MEPLTGTSLSWVDGGGDSTPVRLTIIALLVSFALAGFGMWVLRPASEPVTPVFTCAPGETYTVKECP